MLKRTFIFLLLFYSVNVIAQFQDDFNSLDLSTWNGQTNDFMINNQGQLQLMASIEGQSSIYHDVIFADSLFWDFDINLRFSPSSNNNLQVLLAVDNPNLSEASGYILNLGASGSDDAIDLIRLDNGTENLIASGTPGLVSTSFHINIRLVKNKIDQWTLVTTDLNSLNVSTEFQLDFADNDITSFQYFGFQCNYTNSNTDNFLFDNINIGAIIPDTTPPNLIDLEVLDLSSIQLTFDEALDASTATNTNNYLFNPFLEIENIVFDISNPEIIVLNLFESLNSCQGSNISISNISDALGNVIQPISENISIFEAPQPGDILINELLSNPIGNGVDYVEIINVTSKSLKLKGLIIRNENRNDEIAIALDLTLSPKEIVAFTNAVFNVILTYNPPMDAHIVEHPIPGFNNADGNVSLIWQENGTRRIIDSYDYDDNQLDPNLETLDGVSFERISLIESSNSIGNWNSAKEAFSFGTPGYANSIALNESKNITARIINEQEIEIRFLDQVDISSAINSSNYNIDGLAISDIQLDSENPKIIVIYLASPIESGQIYELNIGNIFSSCGEAIASESTDLRLIENAQVGDILINEILFNPFKDQFDFVELINVSDKFITLDNLNILNSQSDNNENITLGTILNPGEIIALTENDEVVIQQYQPPISANIYINNLPAFNDSEGNITLRFNDDGIFTDLDIFDYNEDFHFDLIRDNEGISLERISTLTETNDPNNWFSSAAINNYATPGYENSAKSINIPVGSEKVFLQYKVFSPNGDSDKDLLFLNYELDKPGYLANVSIYDDKGRHKQTIATNELLSTEGFIRWDGLKADGQLAPIGMYIVRYEFFHPDGDIVDGKLVCVLAQFF